MNKKRIFGLMGGAVAAASLIVASGAVSASSDSSNSQVITIVKDAPFYAQMSEDAATGVLSSFQTLKVKETTGDGMNVWYKVDTWLGEQWIPRKPGMVVLGEIESVNEKMHTLRTELVYDAPYSEEQKILSLPPQEVRITGRYHNWYRINLTDGVPMWLYSPLLLEEIKEEPADWDMLLTRDEQLYEIPYLTKAPIILAPQTVHVLTQWYTGKEGYRFRDIVWYKIQTDQGPRWVLPNGEKAGIKPVQESITLPTGGYGSSAPESNDRSIWLEPGKKLEASARWGDWFQIKTDSTGTVWVNPSLSLHKRPLGTVASSEILYLTKDTAAYTYPSPDAIAHPKGYYAPQEVKSIAKWSGDGILDWYLFRGFEGDLWIPKPRNDTDSSLVGSWRVYNWDQWRETEGFKGIPFALTLMKNSQRHGFYQDEGIPFTLRAQNLSNQSLTVTPSPEFELQIFKLNNEPEEALKHLEQQELVWTRKLPPFAATVLENLSSQSIFIEWDQKGTEGKVSAPGEYAMRIVPVSIHFEMGGGGTRTVTNDDIQKIIGDPVVFAILPNE
ncbi:hypothetical protein BC351_02595 [Paenibacillus ferrarius]|uniref:Uncharacterized protein n=1 Tax=Paenibacillus ferrarius TaxID=1469647 RepID=A0A1V4HT98_9BACL|nr:hypothetical protein [Paenibacillus ferrarius]OPH62140.1 hypothetical protein BC351_02595 [Paenibacillus ferrarius]